MKPALLTYCRNRIDVYLVPAALSGLLLAGAFPPVSQGWLGFLALVPLLLVAERRPFASGLVCGLFFFAPLLYWLNIVMTDYGGLAPFFSVVAWLLLCLYLSLYFGAALWLSCRAQHMLRIPLLVSLPLVWVAFEYLRGILLSGFPWGLLGYAAIDMNNLRQLADLFGVYGLSALFMICNLTLTLFLQYRQPRLICCGLLLCALLLGGGFYYGRSILSSSGSSDLPRMTLGLIQGNIGQHQKWDSTYRQQTLDAYQRLSLKAAKQGARLLIWPEAATPFYLQEKSPSSSQVLRIPALTDTSLLLGSPSYQVTPDNGYRYFNSAFLLGGDGRVLGRSDKIHLVPFGEYVPFAKVLFFINKLVSGVGDFSPGTVRPLALNGHDLGVLICYEAIFPALAREYVNNGSDLLVNITNDAWFGRSSAPRQLLDMTRMRAIENRIWIARAANTGISALIGPDGATLGETPLFHEAIVTGQVELGARPCLYRHIGDLFSYLCLLLSGGLLLGCFIRRQKA
ncbi:apolipoprotein N-acyltransferase [Geopsychrobacter electrodiphilus]|uniref:apolipoprotein N-acyltransferase n=1 Tax=Geopsychrobacter electrodiphilus TaxID=225196 RepID=UPI00037CF519|nr:apolipoprotein N-acyltransferase [Geopsychrobacter electrodiphilus]